MVEAHLAARAGPSAPPVAAMGLRFPGPVGLAAGFDRTGHILPWALERGFGFVELGTVTPLPVCGHNPGVSVLCRNVEQWRSRVHGARCLVGINLGRQPDRLPQSAADDFECGMRCAWRCADYLTINLSGPAGRMLLQPEHGALLTDVLSRLQRQQVRLADETGHRVPMLLKCPIGVGAHAGTPALIGMAPDGVVASLENSGGALEPRQAAIRTLATRLGGRTVIAVGGIRRADDARACLAAGASLVQVYSLYAEEGSDAIARINAALAAARDDTPFQSILG
jgi:dihydroorotate dehydrogenase